MNFMRHLIIILTACIVFSCNKQKEIIIEPATGCYLDTICYSLPLCVRNNIDSALAKPKGTIVYSVDLYKYNGDSVYYFTSGCCDRYNPVKDKNCNYLFAPSGGLGGSGDGTHPNFFSQAQLLKRVWKDMRP
jgi:hypothetical protein